ncbi:MAG: porin [bacterium]
MQDRRKKSSSVCLLVIFFAGCVILSHEAASAQEPGISQESIVSQEPGISRESGISQELGSFPESVTAREPAASDGQDTKADGQDIKAFDAPQAFDTPTTGERRSLRRIRRKDDGFSLSVAGSEGKNQGTDRGAFDLRLGGSLQIDYHYYQEGFREDNRFDIRRASLFLSGFLDQYTFYRLEYELQGNDAKNLVEGYGEWGFIHQQFLRIGQFKEPFSLEWQTGDSALFFIERSMGYYLGPQRDVGLMLSGSFFREIIRYSAGLFNGDGKDGSTRGSRNDQLEQCYRLLIRPFRAVHWPWLSSFQIGGSYNVAEIDLSNVDLEVKSSGMFGTNRNLFVLNQNTKFGILQNVKRRERWALDAGWALGPVALQGEYLSLTYEDLESSGGLVQDADFFSWYTSVLIFLTGERPVFKGGVLQPVTPERAWGGLCLAIREDHFFGDKDWIKEGAFVSIEKADASSIALNWIINPMLRLMVDYTYTDFSDPIRVRVNPDGKVDYIDDENVISTRFHISF